ncbi:MFS transporter [Halorubrum ezzemoulense]|uniref:MFS transporter n=1 Tax=Halorubrum ezzemoulense TaxID=337243 RepID=A0ABT4Z1H0_HALEZ|nr:MULTISPECIES: MFS transporter [Halorubrum]MDB2244548.1 MFS transporter [Halorubrum ezzemoulense]MDB2250755.1 MFS transporter [Halorubrum ezzemoulense]MDB2278695.1 MFS transporter [Halorubrum ezzemoulense]MDB2285369.1 MFS transporter [Halorubrum ezzemoulense]MDB2287882.1 MFS transporter [Halorubrum ezzemoulense]
MSDGDSSAATAAGGDRAAEIDTAGAAADATDRRRLGAVVLAVLISQVLLYPGVPDLVVALGAPAGIDAGMWFLVAEFGAFVTFAVVWGALSDALGTRVPLIVTGALGGAASYVALASLPGLGLGFGAALLVRVVGGALTIGAFSLSITLLMDLRGGNGRNMGTAGFAIGLGAAVGSVVGGSLAGLGALYPVYAGAVVLAAAGLLAATVDDRAATAAASDSGASDSASETDGGGFRDVLARARTTPGLLVPLAFGFVDRLTAGFFALVGVYYFQDPATFGLSAAGAGATLALFFVPFALLQSPFGALSDRIGRFLPVVAGSLAYGVATVGVGVAPAYPIAAALMVLVGVCGALMAPATMALVTDLVEPEVRGAAMGLFNVFGSLGFLAGFLVGGSATGAFGYTPAFLAVGGLELAIALALLPAVRSLSPGAGVIGRLGAEG